MHKLLQLHWQHPMPFGGLKRKLDSWQAQNGLQVLQAPGSHEVRLVAPMQLKVWVFLDTTMSRGNDFVSALCLSWVMMIIFCLRFAHLQRSQVAEIAMVLGAICHQRQK